MFGCVRNQSHQNHIVSLSLSRCRSRCLLCLSVSVSRCMCVCLCVCLPLCLSVHRSVALILCPSQFMSIHDPFASFCLSLSLSIPPSPLSPRARSKAKGYCDVYCPRYRRRYCQKYVERCSGECSGEYLQEVLRSYDRHCEVVRQVQQQVLRRVPRHLLQPTYCGENKSTWNQSGGRKPKAHLGKGRLRDSKKLTNQIHHASDLLAARS